MNSPKSARRSSFDILDLEQRTQTLEIKELNYSSNSCHKRIIFINVSFLVSLILIIIFIKIPKQENIQKNDLKLKIE